MDHSALMEAIAPIILQNGIKAVTMDNVASRLGISKRTLYEIFENKNDMICCVIKHSREKHRQKFQQILEESDDFLEMLIRLLMQHREFISSISANFLSDMDTIYREMRPFYDSLEKDNIRDFIEILNHGIEEGIIRNDINLEVHIRMLHVQMESIKRVEEIFPPEFTALDVYDNIVFSFMRSMVTARHILHLDELLKNYSIQNTHNNSEKI